MWRAFFMAIGISLCILGMECLVFEKAVLNKRRQEPPPSFVPGLPYLQTPTVQPSYPEIRFADWAPWTLICAGSVVICYSLTVAKT